MKELSFERMEEVKGGEWCMWGFGHFYYTTSVALAQSYYSNGYSMSYCIV